MKSVYIPLCIHLYNCIVKVTFLYTVFCICICVYIHCMYGAIFFSWPVSSSVTNATSMLVCSPVASELYNITVTCTIHPDSTADQCEVRAVNDGEVTRTGNVYIIQVTCCYLCYMHWLLYSSYMYAQICTFHTSL